MERNSAKFKTPWKLSNHRLIALIILVTDSPDAPDSPYSSLLLSEKVSYSFMAFVWMMLVSRDLFLPTSTYQEKHCRLHPHDCPIASCNYPHRGLIRRHCCCRSYVFLILPNSPHSICDVLLRYLISFK